MRCWTLTSISANEAAGCALFGLSLLPPIVVPVEATKKGPCEVRSAQKLGCKLGDRAVVAPFPNGGVFGGESVSSEPGAGGRARPKNKYKKVFTQLYGQTAQGGRHSVYY